MFNCKVKTLAAAGRPFPAPEYCRGREAAVTRCGTIWRSVGARRLDTGNWREKGQATTDGQVIYLAWMIWGTGSPNGLIWSEK